MGYFYCFRVKNSNHLHTELSLGYFKGTVTSSNVLRKGSLQTKLNAGLSEQQQEDLFQNERSFHEVKL